LRKCFIFEKPKKTMAKNCDECKTYTLREIPTPVYSLLIDKQAELKKQHKNISPKNLEQTIYTIIREWELFKKSKPAIVMKDDDDFTVLIDMTEIRRGHLFNAINKKMAG